jgi:hypothetical protein
MKNNFGQCGSLSEATHTIMENNRKRALTAIKALKNRPEYNLENKTEEEIANDMRKIDEQMYLDSLKADPYTFYSFMPVWLSELDAKNRYGFFSQLLMITKALSNSNLTPESKQKKMKRIQNFDRRASLFQTSQEAHKWRQAGLNKPSVDELWVEAVKRSGEEGITLDKMREDLKEGKVFTLDLEKVLEYMQEILFEHFFLKSP